MKNGFEDFLFIAYDYHNDRELPFFVIFRKQQDKIEIVKLFKGEFAEKLYNWITGKVDF